VAARGSVADLVRTLQPIDGKKWFARLSGREAKSGLEEEISRWFSEPGAAGQALQRLSAPCRLAVGLLAEAPAGLTSAELEYELGELGGKRLVEGALQDVSAAGLVFTARQRGAPGPSPVAADTLLVLPGPLRAWLAPAALPLLLASAEAPPPGMAGADVSGDAEDPGLSDALGLAALRAVCARTTGDRLYKKDRQRVESLIGPRQADQMLRDLTLKRLVRLPREPGAAVEIRWAEVERWARRPGAARMVDDLARRHGGTLVWATLVGARGAWVEEVHLARRSRLVISSVYSRARPNPALRQEAWARHRTEMETWPEVEIGQHDGRRFFRLRPGLAAALRAGSPHSPAAPGKIFVQPDFEVLVPRDAGLGPTLLLARVGRLARADVVATFTLTPESIRQAVLEGVSAERIVADLKALAAHGVPAAVERAIRDWAGNAGRCTVTDAVVVRFDDESLATRAEAALGRSAERVGPTVFVVRGSYVPEAEELLQKAGFPPRPSGEYGEDDGDDGDLEGDSDDDHDGGRHAAPGTSGDRLAAILGLTGVDPDGLCGEIDGKVIESVRAARAGLGSGAAGMVPALGAGRRDETGRGPGPAAGRPATSLEPIARTIERAARSDADVVVVLRDGSELVVRPMSAPHDTAGGVLRAFDRATGSVRELLVESIASVLALYGTSRTVPRNQPCPCGSGRKFKRCCLPSDHGSHELGGA
jgi:hypothetical protein